MAVPTGGIASLARGPAAAKRQVYRYRIFLSVRTQSSWVGSSRHAMSSDIGFTSRGRTDRAGGDFVTKCLVSDVRASSTRQILGLRFFNGDVDDAVAFMHRHGGYLVAPSGTCFTRLREDESYRRAVLAADLAIADSGLMVLPWRLLRREKFTAFPASNI